MPKPMDRRQLLLLLPALAAAACGRGPVGPGSPEAVAPAPGPDGLADGDTGHLLRHIDSSPRTLDPTLNTEVPAQRVIDDLFEGLVRVAPDGSLVPGVARHWETLEDGRLLRFELRDDARWSNGDPVTAGDFLYSWRRLVDPATASQSSQWVAAIEGALDIATGKADPATLGVRVVDDHTLEVRLLQPTPWFLYLLTNTFLMPLHRATIEAHGERWTRPEHLVGNGAFTLASFRINGSIVLDANPAYWDAASVALRRVTYVPIEDRNAVISRYLAGDFQVADSFAIDEIDWLRGRIGTQARLAPYFGTVMFAFDVRRAPFDSLPLREALLMALDREIITEKLLHGLFLPAYGIVPPLAGYEADLPAWTRLPPAERRALARERYAEAGYGPDRPLRAAMVVATSGPDMRRLFEAMSAMWRVALGAEIAVEPEEFKVLQQNRELRKLRLFWHAWIGDYPDPLTFLDLPRRSSPQNFGGFDDARYEELLDAAVATVDERQRLRLYAQAERVLMDQAALLPVYFYQSRHLLSPWVRGWQDNPMDRHLSRDLSLVAPT
jgi:oligopeptide transport system substrate-binding protein